MASLVGLKNSVSAMVDLSTTAINNVFTEADGSAVDLNTLASTERDSFYSEFEKKSKELYENVRIGGASAVSGVIARVKHDVSTAVGGKDRFTTAQANDLETALKGLDKKMEEIETFINGLTETTPQAEVKACLDKIDTLVIADNRKKYFRKLTDKAVTVYGALDEDTKALEGAEKFLQFVAQTVFSNNNADASNLISLDDIKRDVGIEWNSQQAHAIGTNYEHIFQEERRLRGLLGGDFDSSRTENAEAQIRTKLDDVRVGGPREQAVHTQYSGASGALRFDIDKLVNGIADFVKVATDAELDEFINNVDEFKNLLPSTATSEISKYTNAKTAAEDEKVARTTAGSPSHGRTGKDISALDADINTWRNTDLPALESARDTAKAEFDKEVKRLSFEQLSFVQIDSQKDILERNTSRTAEQNIDLQIITDIYNRRAALDTSLQGSTSDLEDEVTRMIGNPPAFDVSAEIANRSALQGLLDKSLSELSSVTQANVNNLFPYSSTISNLIWSKINEEIAGRRAAIAGTGTSGYEEKFADKSLAELRQLYTDVTAGHYDSRLDDLVKFPGTYPSNKFTVAAVIHSTIVARQGMAAAWFNGSDLSAAGAKNSADLDKLSKINAELQLRKNEAEKNRLDGALSVAKGNVTNKEDQIKEAERCKDLKSYAKNLHTNLDNRRNGLAAIATERTRLTALLATAQSYDQQVKYKNAAVKVMHDVETQFKDKRRVEDTEVENAVNSHAAFQTGGDLHSHPNRDALKTEMTNALKTRVNKVKKVTSKKRSLPIWGHALAGTAGFLGSFAVRKFLPAIVPQARMASWIIGGGLAVGECVVNWAMNNASSNRVAKIIDAPGNWLRTKHPKFAKFLAGSVKAIRTAALCYGIGDLVASGIPSFNQNPPADPAVPEAEIPSGPGLAPPQIIGKNVKADLSVLTHASEGPGCGFEKILDWQKEYWKDATWNGTALLDSTNDCVLLPFDTVRGQVGCVTPQQLVDAGFTIDSDMQAAINLASTAAKAKGR